MAWCSVKAQGQFYLYLNFTLQSNVERKTIVNGDGRILIVEVLILDTLIHMRSILKQPSIKSITCGPYDEDSRYQTEVGDSVV
jgi:hypothetical protein